MQQKSNAQMEQEKRTAAWGLCHEDLEVLYEECRDKLAEVESDLMDIVENKVTASADFVHRVFHAIHTVKGAASHLVHDPMKDLSQAAENVLSQARDRVIDLNSAVAEVLLTAVARLEEMAIDVDRLLEIDCSVELDRLRAVLNPEKPTRVRFDPAAEPVAPGDNYPLAPAPRPSHPLKALIVEDELDLPPDPAGSSCEVRRLPCRRERC